MGEDGDDLEEVALVAVVVSVLVVVSANDVDEAEGEGAVEGVAVVVVGEHEHDDCDATDITKFAGLISRCTIECECTNSIREICGVCNNYNWSSVR